MIKGIIAVIDFNYKHGLLAPRSLIKAFTLVELIIVIIVIGILASLGLTQYTAIVEKSRLAEARVRIGVMRSYACQYYMENGTLATLTDADVGVDYTCAAGSYFKYTVRGIAGPSPNKGVSVVCLEAMRCTSGGKTPDAGAEYLFYLIARFDGSSDVWRCGSGATYSTGCYGFQP